jgi:hypothetical protein
MQAITVLTTRTRDTMIPSAATGIDFVEELPDGDIA